MTSPILDSRIDARARIIDVASQLLRDEGPAAVTTRGVAAQAGVQAPAIYRLFGDKDGLLEAVAEHVMSTYVTAKRAHVTAAASDGVDPLDDLRDGWHSQIDFGVANPALFRLLGDPARVQLSEAAQSGRRVLEERVHRVAVAGRLRVSEERAVGMIQAAGTGAIQTILASRPEHQDPGLATAMLDAVLARILLSTGADVAGDATVPAADVAGDATVPAAVTLRAAAADLAMLSSGERTLLAEWLARVVAAAPAPAPPAAPAPPGS